VRVHPQLLRAEDVPGSGAPGHGKRHDVWRERFRSIVEHERHLHANGTRIVKFFLHLSRDEQRRRFLDRIDDPKKNWKITNDDIEERKYWADYQAAYAACIGATSTRDSPWYVIPADDKLNARLLVSQVVTETLADLGLEFPKTSAKRRAELRDMRAALEADR